jgi:flagellar motor switch protein FliN
MSVGTGTRLNNYYEAWIGSLSLLLSQISGATWSVEPADAVADYRPLAHLRLTSSALAGGQVIALSAVDTGKLLHLFLSEAVSVEGELDEMQREALLELVRQWCGLAATALKPRFGELSFEAALLRGPAEGGQQVRFLRASEGSSAVIVQMEMDAALAAQMRDAGKAPASSEAAAAQDRSGGQVEKLLRQGNLDLLMDVELPVMLRFGKRQTTLREVLDLATGAVLELDREIQEPVDLVLHEKIIARGEVVVVDGNYGLRVTEVASPEQRVSSL